MPLFLNMFNPEEVDTFAKSERLHRRQDTLGRIATRFIAGGAGLGIIAGKSEIVSGAGLAVFGVGVLATDLWFITKLDTRELDRDNKKMINSVLVEAEDLTRNSH